MKKPKSTKVLLRGSAARERKWRELWGDGCHPGVVNVSLCGNGHRQAVSWLAHTLWWGNSDILGLETESEEIWFIEALGKPSPEAAVWLQICQAGDRTLKTRDILESLLLGVWEFGKDSSTQENSGRQNLSRQIVSRNNFDLGIETLNLTGAASLVVAKEGPVYNLGMKMKNKL